jgi:hypothetical protein
VSIENIFDAMEIDCPDWASVNDNGMWCNFCGDLLIASFHVDADTEAPEGCRNCGAPDDVEQMAEYFAGEEE